MLTDSKEMCRIALLAADDLELGADELERRDIEQWSHMIRREGWQDPVSRRLRHGAEMLRALVAAEPNETLVDVMNRLYP